MPEELNKTNAAAKPQGINLAKIHPLPGIKTAAQPDAAYGGLVTSIRSNGVKEPVILRLREDGEYELVAGYRRLRACELAKKTEIPAWVYEMTAQEAKDYHAKANVTPVPPIPGKLHEPSKEKEKAPEPAKEAPKVQPEEKAKIEEKPKEEPKTKMEETTEKKPSEKTEEKASETKAEPAEKATASGAAAKGPAGTTISQIFEARLNPPDEKALKALPVPKEGESFSIVLHPGYLKKSKFNNFSVDKNSENFRELKASIEQAGIHDPVLTRIDPDGGLEILSGQRRHLAATELNYPVPAIIQKIDDADAKIIVADGNLHRDKITTFDLSRALRMKMEGMKQKSGRKKKGEISAEELNSDEKLAKEMGMSTSKLNRLIRLSEAVKEVCDRVDEGGMELSVASAISFLQPKNQTELLHLADLGYKISNLRVERMKKVEKAGKLTEQTMRDILDDKDIAPKPVEKAAPVLPTPNVTLATPSAPTAAPAAVQAQPAKETTPTVQPAATVAPAVQQPPAAAAPTQVPAASGTVVQIPAGKETSPFRGAQERPESTKVILAGDRLRKYFPDVSMTPREIEESIYDALEERRQRQEKAKQKPSLMNSGQSR